MDTILNDRQLGKKLNLFLSASSFHVVLDIGDAFSVLVLDLFWFLFCSEQINIFPQKLFAELT